MPIEIIYEVTFVVQKTFCLGRVHHDDLHGSDIKNTVDVSKYQCFLLCFLNYTYLLYKILTSQVSSTWCCVTIRACYKVVTQ